MQGRGRRDSTIAVPMELLHIKKGQKRKGLLIGDQQANLVRYAAQKPNDKIRDISTWASGAQAPWASVIGKFGMAVDNKMKQVTGRVLPPPTIGYGVPANYFAGTVGAWNMEVRLMFILSHTHAFTLQLHLAVAAPLRHQVLGYHLAVHLNLPTVTLLVSVHLKALIVPHVSYKKNNTDSAALSLRSLPCAELQGARPLHHQVLGHHHPASPSPRSMYTQTHPTGPSKKRLIRVLRALP